MHHLISWKRIRRAAAGSLLAIGLLSLSSCQTYTQRGALVGGLSGAALGAIAADNSGAGALVGGAIGASAGAALGHAKDRRYHRWYYGY